MSSATGSDDHMSAEELSALVGRLGDVAARLARANPKEKAALYAAFGLDLTYEPHKRVVTVTANVDTMGLSRVRGET